MAITDNITDGISNFTQVKDAFNKYLVTPLNNFGLGGFVFDVEGDTVVNLSADITDHYTEGNFSVQDHIAIRPKKITLKNYVGELVYRQDSNTNTTLQKVTQKLTVVNAYLPVLAKGAQQVKSLLNTSQDKLDFNTTLNTTANIWGLVKNLNPPIPKQQQAYQFFKALMESKILVSVQTPFEYATNMAIESIIATQPEESRFISDFSITLKEIRLAEIKTTPFAMTIENAQMKNAIQSASVQNGGQTQGVSTSTGVLQ